ncbi:peptide deformylase 1B [Perilla frutescens var. hirtella]|uniref:Peptide deformylase n=1 Tax=Perilla frutescens var. hirtella TaxID=608512 RepID=A0AAD4NZ83_PERFH|nr:peptide deformylase 1B [Perilla frutescens var. hirtella]
MAALTSKHSTALTHAILPFLHRHALISAISVSSFSRRHKSPVQPIHAQARRMRKDELVASPSDLLFKEPLEIVKYPDPILRVKNKRVNSFDESLKRLVHEMFDVMYRTDGIGLSAPQVGVNIQLMVFNPVGERGQGEEIVLVNPRINRFSRKIVTFNEGCLSFPGIYADVKRPDSLKVSAQDITGARFEMNLTELPARVFQHEYDHLQGILFFDRMSDEVLDTIRAELLALEKEYEEKSGLTSPEKIETRERRKKAVGFGKS